MEIIMINANDYATPSAAFRAALKAYRRVEHVAGASITIVNTPWTLSGELILAKPDMGGSWGG